MLFVLSSLVLFDTVKVNCFCSLVCVFNSGCTVRKMGFHNCIVPADRLFGQTSVPVYIDGATKFGTDTLREKTQAISMPVESRKRYFTRNSLGIIDDIAIG